MENKIQDPIFAEDARLSLLLGINKLTKAVKTTLGPNGRTVLIEKKHNQTYLTKDGVTVAKSITLKDKIENIGAQLIKEVASKTADEAGDGTTTATILANSIYTQGIKHITAGADPTAIKSGMEIAKDIVLEQLKSFVKPVTTYDELVNVATISANGNQDIGDMVASAINEIGKDGVLTVEEAMGTADELKITNGLQFDKGYMSPYFVTDTAKMEVSFKDPYILLYNDRIPHIKSVLPALTKASTDKKPLVIICNELDEESLNTLVVNKIRGNVDVVVVKSPGFGDIPERLKDIQVVVGGNIQNPTKGIVFDDLSKDLGTATSVIVTKNSCTIINKEANQQNIDNRVQEIKTLLESTKESYMINILKERIAKLSGGVAVIKVQAPSEIETKEKKDRVDDAIGAVRAAQDEGIIIGGGTAMYKVSNMLSKPNNMSTEQKITYKKLRYDQKIGFDIVLNAIREPFTQILINAGKNVDTISNKIQRKPLEYGYNVRDNKFGNLFDEGVIDSYKVQRAALTNAISVSSTLLTTECIVPLLDT